MFEYYMLKDSNYNGMIVKKEKETRKEFYFDANEKVWKPIGIMLRYFLPESDTFELYEELSKEKALEVIS